MPFARSSAQSVFCVRVRASDGRQSWSAIWMTCAAQQASLNDRRSSRSGSCATPRRLVTPMFLTLDGKRSFRHYTMFVPEPSTNWRLAWLNLGCFDLILHAVTFPINNHGFSVVQEAVQHGAGEGAVVVEDFGPVFIRLVGGQQDGALFVTLADDLEEQVRAGFVDGQVA